MRIQNVASACVVIEHHGIRVLCDPWLSESAYMGSWYHNPPLTVRPEDFHDVDFIYLSHIHQDHCDLETLKRLNIETDPRLLRRLLTRKAHWNAAEIGSHLTFWREPNIYERAPYYALSYLHI